jgi:hypothetical protein
MIRFPKRKPQSDQLDEADILETEEVAEAVRTSELMAVDLDDADLLLDRAPSQQHPEGVGQVMASLEAEMSRALEDGTAAWVAPREGSALGASAHPAQPLTASSFQSSPPPAPESRSRFPSARPGPASVPPAPASVRPAASSHAPPSAPSSPFSAPAPSSPFIVAPHVVVPAAAASTAAMGQGLPPHHGHAPPREPTVVVVREKPGFSWVIASLALGALAAIVGMRVASGLGKPAPAPVVSAAALPAQTAASAALVPAAPPAPPTISPEALLSASPPKTDPAVVAFDDKDAVHVNVEARPVVAQAPAPAPVSPSTPAASASSVASAASASAKSTPSAAPTTKPGDPPPLVPDPPTKPVVAAPTPPPAPPPAKTRAKTPEEQLLEAQLKAAQR